MEWKREDEWNDNGSVFRKETIRTTPEDGAVPEHKIRPAALHTETAGKAHIGYSTTKTFSTNDPRVTRPLVLAFCVIFGLIGIVTLLLGLWGFSILFLAAAGFIFVKANRQIDEIAEDLAQQGKDVTIDSPEELHEVMTGVSEELKTGFQECAQETFTEDHIRRMTKLTLPIYGILGLAAAGLLTVVAGRRMGLLVLLLFLVGGVVYYAIFLPLLVKLFKK